MTTETTTQAPGTTRLDAAIRKKAEADVQQAMESVLRVALNSVVAGWGRLKLSGAARTDVLWFCLECVNRADLSVSWNRQSGNRPDESRIQRTYNWWVEARAKELTSRLLAGAAEESNELVTVRGYRVDDPDAGAGKECQACRAGSSS